MCRREKKKTIQNKKLNKNDEDEKWIIMRILVNVYIYFGIIYYNIKSDYFLICFKIYESLLK